MIQLAGPAVASSPLGVNYRPFTSESATKHLRTSSKLIYDNILSVTVTSVVAQARMTAMASDMTLQTHLLSAAAQIMPSSWFSGRYGSIRPFVSI